MMVNANYNGLKLKGKNLILVQRLCFVIESKDFKDNGKIRLRHSV